MEMECPIGGIKTRATMEFWMSTTSRWEVPWMATHVEQSSYPQQLRDSAVISTHSSSRRLYLLRLNQEGNLSLFRTAADPTLNGTMGHMMGQITPLEWVVVTATVSGSPLILLATQPLQLRIHTTTSRITEIFGLLTSESPSSDSFSGLRTQITTSSPMRLLTISTMT